MGVGEEGGVLLTACIIGLSFAPTPQSSHRLLDAAAPSSTLRTLPERHRSARASCVCCKILRFSCTTHLQASRGVCDVAVSRIDERSGLPAPTAIARAPGCPTRVAQPASRIGGFCFCSIVVPQIAIATKVVWARPPSPIRPPPYSALTVAHHALRGARSRSLPALVVCSLDRQMLEALFLAVLTACFDATRADV